MKKRILTLAVAGIIALSSTLTSFAGQWKQDTSGWWYQNDDGSFHQGGWTWVDGRCYYFAPSGYCLTNTTTPDGFQVDASGAWIINGVVQTQPQSQPASAKAGEVSVDNLFFTPPSGFHYDSNDGNSYYFVNSSNTTAIVVSSEVIGEWGDQEMALGAAIEEPLLNAAVELTFGVPSRKEVKQLNSGRWYWYQFASGAINGIPGSMHAYARIVGNRVQMISFAGELAGIDTDSIMNNNLR